MNEEYFYEFEDVDYVLDSLLSMTKKGQLKWECIGMSGVHLDVDVVSRTERGYRIAQDYYFSTLHNGAIYKLEISEIIDILTGKWNVTLNVEKSGVGESYEYYTELSRDEDDYDITNVVRLYSVFQDNYAVQFARLFAPIALASDVDKECNEKFDDRNEAPESVKICPIYLLGERLHEDRRFEDFHKAVYHIGFRSRLMKEYKCAI